MGTERVDKEVLKKGIQFMFISLLMMFTGPTLFYIATTNKEKALYIPLLIISLIICAVAIIMAFKGLKTIMRSLFGNSSNED